MYVKIVHTLRGTEANDLYSVPMDLSYGERYLYPDDFPDTGTGGEGEHAIDRACWTDLLGIESNAYIHVAVDTKPSGFNHRQPMPGPDDPPLDCEKDHHPFWVVRWAWWYVTPERRPSWATHSIEAVVTTGQMFVMGDNGDTIERVR